MAKIANLDKILKFIEKAKLEGKDFKIISKEYNKKFKDNKTPGALTSFFNRHSSDSQDREVIKNSKKKLRVDKIKKICLEFIEKNKYFPSQKEIINFKGIHRVSVIRDIGSIEKLEEMLRLEHPEVFKDIIDENAFTDKAFEDLEKRIKKYRRFVITSAVTGSEVFESGLAALESYCKLNKALLLIQPCSDPASNSSRRSRWSLDHRLPKENIVFKDIKLNENVLLSSIKTSAKQINPLTGLSRMGQREGSFIYASPKQFLEYIPNSNKAKLPRAMITCGTITKPNYDTDRYMSERLAYIANHDHTLGGVIVELEKDGKFFHFRHFQIEPKTGSFIDLGTEYRANGNIKEVRADLVQLGDFHSGVTDPNALRMGKEICDLVRPKILTVEDFHDGLSINHHVKDMFVSKARMAILGLDNLERELDQNRKDVNDLLTWNIGNLYFKYGNHEDFIKRWLENGTYLKDAINHRIGHKLASAMLDGFMPFEYALRKLFPVENQSRIHFLKAGDSLVINGIENARHGDRGGNGKRNPGLENIEKSFGRANIGHSHTAAIHRGVFRVGTTSFLEQEYNKDDPSSWTHTHLIQYPNGSRQLINLINNKWRL